MKMVVFFALLVISLNVFADTTEVDLVRYKQNSNLPDVLKVLVNDAVVTKCPFIVRKGWEVVESSTAVAPSAPDTLVTGADYKTVLTVLASDNDEMHPYQFSIKVVSVAEKLHSKNPEYAVVSLTSGDYCSK